MAQEVDELKSRAAELEANGMIEAAMKARERLLMLLQPVFGDPSPQTDEQKLMLCKLILRVADARDEKENKKAERASLLGSPSRSRRPSTASIGKASQLLTESLSSHGLLAFGERLLSPGNTLPATQEESEVMLVRGKLMMALGLVLHRQNRPRAALPMVERALSNLEAVAGDTPSVDISSANLTLCALHSAAGHHMEALYKAHVALEEILEVEELLWKNDPEATSAAAANNTSTRSEENDAEQDGKGNGNAARRGDRGLASAADPPPNDEYNEDEDAPIPPRQKVYYGGVQAACYHNLSTEQEHLGMYELALESCQTGFELAFLANGANHPLTQRLKHNYAELFTSLHYRHFVTRKKHIKAPFEDPQKAVAQLNSSYITSLKHRKALQKEKKSQWDMLRLVESRRTPHSLMSMSQTSLSGKLTPNKAASLRHRPPSAASGAANRSSRPASAAQQRRY